MSIGGPELLILLVFGVAAASAIGYVVSRARRPNAASIAPVNRPRRGLLNWLTNLLMAIAVTALAAVAGTALALFHLGGIALLTAIGILVVAFTVWRRAVLPLSVVAGTLAISAAVQASQPVRVHPSSGLLIAHPRTPSQISPAYTRGAGSVLVDLRDVVLLSNRRTFISARSDLGMVVVALPRDRCVNLRVHMKRRPVNSLTARAARSIAIEQGALTEGQTTDIQKGGYEPLVGPGDLQSQEKAGRFTPALIAYGQAINADQTGEVNWERRSDDPNAPWLNLDLSAGTNAIVRDYPDALPGIRTSVPYDEGAGRWGPELARVLWPEPPPKTEMRPASRRGFAIKPSRSDIENARVRASLAAGSCATRAQLRSHQTIATWSKSQRDMEIATVVNGLGKFLMYLQTDTPF